MKNFRHSITFSLVLLLPFISGGVAQAQLPDKATIAGRLNYLTATPSFSAAKPLSQKQLLSSVQEIGYWGIFPDKYKSKDKMEGSDGYITRTNARRFMKGLVGQDLRIWTGGDIWGDKLGWTYNTSNTMYVRPWVRVISRTGTRSRVTARFEVLEKRENLSNNPPTIKSGTGTATLVKKQGNWVVTSWQVKRKG